MLFNLIKVNPLVEAMIMKKGTWCMVMVLLALLSQAQAALVITNGDFELWTAGIPDGVKNFGGTMEHVIREIKVRCLPTEIPAKINVDVSGLGIGQGITVANLPKLEGIEYVHDASSIVVNVLLQKVEEEKPAEAAAAEPQAPEVISKGKKDAEGEAAAAAPAAPKK